MVVSALDDILFMEIYGEPALLSIRTANAFLLQQIAVLYACDFFQSALWYSIGQEWSRIATKESWWRPEPVSCNAFSSHEVIGVVHLHHGFQHVVSL